MTSLEDHAASTSGPECHRVRDLPQEPPGLIVRDTLVDADEISDEGQFPEHGKWLKVVPESLKTESGWADEPEFWECPSALAQEVVDELPDDADGPTDADLAVDVVSAVGGGEEPWQFRTTVFEADVE